MAQLLVRNIEENVKLRLQRLASQHGRSMEEEVRDILRDAARSADSPSLGLGTGIASLFRGVGIEEEIPELRGHELKPMAFND